MEWVKAINDAIEFMEKNLTEKIGLVEVADSVNISAFHFHHAFTIMTGITPAEYIRNRRLSLAGALHSNTATKLPKALPRLFPGFTAVLQCRRAKEAHSSL